MSHQVRYKRTLEFMKKSSPPPQKVLDLGTENAFSKIMKEAGYEVSNTGGEDLDFNTEAVQQEGFDLVTGFEILEHLLNPLGVLKDIKAPRIMLSIPMRLWFAKAYRHPTNRWDQHYHEFEDWQFDWLLEKAGWKIIRREKWKSLPPHPFGFRPILRHFTDRYYIIEAVRENAD